MHNRKALWVPLVMALVLAAPSAPARAFSGRGRAATGASAAPGTPATPECADPGDSFQRVEPATAGLDGEKLQAAIDFATTKGAGAVKVYRFGCVVGTSRLDPVSSSLVVPMWSATKTVVGLLVGRAETLGLLDMDDPIGTYLPPGMGDAEHRAVTIRQLMQMTSGLHMDWPSQLNPAPVDQVREALALPFDHAPGTHWEYNQIPVTLLAFTVERVVGKDFQDWAQEQLFGPIGIERATWSWSRDRAGHTMGAFHFSSAPENMSRLGHLMLKGGSWQGHQLVAERFVREMTRGQELNPGYGLLAWTNSADWFHTTGMPGSARLNRPLIASAPRDMFFAYGLDDQYIFVLPALRMVIVRTGAAMVEADDLNSGTAFAAYQGKALHEWFRLLMAAVTDGRMADPGPWTPDPPGLYFTPEYWTDVPGLLRTLGLGPGAPEGCNPLGCDGNASTVG